MTSRDLARDPQPRPQEVGRGPIRRVVIVGGGTSGWLSAAYLTRLYGPATAEQLQITLVEAEDIGIIGVGEATIPSMRTTLRKIGVPEAEFLSRCNGSFKLGIKFRNWHSDPSQAPDDTFWNPFGILPFAWDVPVAAYWLRARLGGQQGLTSFANDFSIHPTLAEAYRAPKGPGTPDYDRVAAYAYHLDTVLFGRYLREIAIDRGVRRIVDKVVGVVRDERGFIERLELESNEDLKGDLYLDCSGFRSLLLQDTLEEPFVGYGDGLLCDSAIAISKPWQGPPVKLKPYTTSSAREAGWVWEIPLYTRLAHGYVYSGKHVTADAAETAFRRFIDDEKGENEAKHIKMKIGRARRLWVGNCVAIGLAGGFIEPLESTGIYMVETGLELLGQYFPDRGLSPELQRLYNQHMTEIYDATRDFIVYHYCMTAREDTQFWRDCRHGLKRSDALEALLALWRNKVPSPFDFSSKVFSYNHYSFLMAGHEAWPDVAHANIELLDDQAGFSAYKHVAALRRKALAELPDNYSYLKSLHEGGGTMGEMDLQGASFSLG